MIPIGVANISSMMLLALLAFVGIGMAVAMVPVTTEVLAQDNMTYTGNMTGNMTDMGNMTGNMTEGSGSISGIVFPP